ncbi:uncharacterized protein [Periplaneta americana]|uniref:uncharacterized protein n=1 Tax=Periplaneta americana TaxID=6978 RepID=UPI0037E8BBCF
MSHHSGTTMSEGSSEPEVNEACTRDVVVLDLATTSLERDTIISISSSSLDSDSGSGISDDKTWADAEDDFTSDSDCVIIEPEEQSRETKNTLAVQKRDLAPKSSSEDSHNTNTRRRNPKREAAMASLKNYQLSPVRTVDTEQTPLRRSSRHLKLSLDRCYKSEMLEEETAASRSTSPLALPSASAHSKRCGLERTSDAPRKKSKMPAPSCSHQQYVMNTRSVTRRLGSEGCALVPPTPEDALELREWPATGMHERPVWPDPRYELPPPPVSELQVALHHSLHAVLAFSAQVAGTSTVGASMPIGHTKKNDTSAKTIDFGQDKSPALSNKTTRTFLNKDQNFTAKSYKDSKFNFSENYTDKNIFTRTLSSKGNLETKKKYMRPSLGRKRLWSSLGSETLIKSASSEMQEIILDDDRSENEHISSEKSYTSKSDNPVLMASTSGSSKWINSKGSEIFPEISAYDVSSDPLRADDYLSDRDVGSTEHVQYLRTGYSSKNIKNSILARLLGNTGEPATQFSMSEQFDIRSSGVLNEEERKYCVNDNEKEFSLEMTVSSESDSDNVKRLQKDGGVAITPIPVKSEKESPHLLSSKLGQGVESASCKEISENSTNDTVLTADINEISTEKVMELLRNTAILYCALCCVSQRALAEYIDSMSADSALQWLQETKEK